MEIAKAAGEFAGLAPDVDIHRSIVVLRSAVRTIQQTAKLTGASESQVKRIWALHLKGQGAAYKLFGHTYVWFGGQMIDLLAGQRWANKHRSRTIVSSKGAVTYFSGVNELKTTTVAIYTFLVWIDHTGARLMEEDSPLPAALVRKEK